MGDAVNRRSFAGFGLAAVGGIFVPQFGRWFQRLNEPVGGMEAIVASTDFSPYHNLASHHEVWVTYAWSDGSGKRVSQRVRAHDNGHGIITVPAVPFAAWDLREANAYGISVNRITNGW